MKIEVNLNENQITQAIIDELMKHRLFGQSQNVTITYNYESEDILYTVTEVSKLIKSNPTYVYELIKAGLIPVLKLGSYKIRRKSLIEFLDKYEGKDLTNPFEIKRIELNKA